MSLISTTHTFRNQGIEVEVASLVTLTNPHQKFFFFTFSETDNLRIFVCRKGTFPLEDISRVPLNFKL